MQTPVRIESRYYEICELTQRDVPGLAALHIIEQPDGLLSRLGVPIVEGFYRTLLEDRQNFVGVAVRAKGADAVVAFCVGLVRVRGLTRYFWGSNPIITGARIARRVAIAPSLWRPAALQIFGWCRASARGKPRASEAPEPEHCAILVEISCASQYRQQGVGREIVSAWENRMSARGVGLVRLYVRQSNDDAIRFYRSCGWKIQREMRNIHSPGYIMTKTLRPVVEPRQSS